jgi:LPS-assembly lipoprotein
MPAAPSGHPITRRVTLRRVTLAASALMLAGCGFKLRQAPEFVFESIFMSFQANSTLGNELRRNMAANGKVTVLDGANWAKADVILQVLQEAREKAVVSLNSSGQVREFQLRLRFRFRLGTADGKVLIPDTEILQQRDISFNESVVLSKEAEEALLYRDMQSDVVQQLLRRLAALKAL